MAKKISKNGTIATASGVKADCSDRLERVIDHMTCEPHIAATTSVFVVMHSPEKNGAPGLLEAVNKTLDLT